MVIDAVAEFLAINPHARNRVQLSLDIANHIRVFKFHLVFSLDDLIVRLATNIS